MKIGSLLQTSPRVQEVYPSNTASCLTRSNSNRRTPRFKTCVLTPSPLVYSPDSADEQWPNNFDAKTFDTSLFNLPQSHHALGGNAQNLPQLPVDNTTPVSLPGIQSVQSHAESSNSGHSPDTRKRRREGDGARRIVVANFSNETDALEILADAATDDKKDHYGDSNEQDGTSGGRKVAFEDRVSARLDEFVLVKERVLDIVQLELLIRVFFEHHHAALVCPSPSHDRYSSLWHLVSDICSRCSKPPAYPDPILNWPCYAVPSHSSSRSSWP